MFLINAIYIFFTGGVNQGDIKVKLFCQTGIFKVLFIVLTMQKSGAISFFIHAFKFSTETSTSNTYIKACSTTIYILYGVLNYVEMV